MNLRTYTPSDETQVIDLWSLCGLIAPTSDPKRDIQRKLQVHPELFIVGALEDTIIATAMAGYDGHRGYIYYLAVHPTHQHRGYGTRLVRHIQSLLRELGCPKVNLFVSMDNLSVIAFYERLGFSRNDMISMGLRL